MIDVPTKYSNGEARFVKSSVWDLDAAEVSTSHVPVDEVTRYRLISSLQQAAEDLETPNDTMIRYNDAGRQSALVNIGGDLGIFKALVESKTPLSSTQLAKAKMADPLLISRIMRYMVASRLVGETAPDQYVASKKTYVFADPRIENSIRFFHAVSNPAFQALPEFLKETGYQNESKSSAFQKGHGTELELFPWLRERPNDLKNFQAVMQINKDNSNTYVVPFDDSVSCGHDGVIFVDIGGNVGHQAAEVLSKHPELAGRVMVQDLGEVIQRHPDIKGAKYYYLRHILHNWTDNEAVQILANIVPAMSADSLVAIDEVVMPEMNAHSWPAGLDIQMYAMFRTMERTALQWDAILDKAGLRAVKVKRISPVMCTAVIYAARK
ncbi:MAG: hypothetical protein LQ350_006396 [Teloschistes chrysophthalmus]|nr:MAG: hypothetical protein LQ350_006396 [Niorma chrysophthalma]